VSEIDGFFGELIRPNDPGHDDVRRTWNGWWYAASRAGSRDPRARLDDDRRHGPSHWRRGMDVRRRAGWGCLARVAKR